MSNQNLLEEEQNEIHEILMEINASVLSELKNKKYDFKNLDITLHRIYQFTLDKPLSMTKGTREKIFRFMKDLHESIENLLAIHSHRTPISLKAYCEIFIYIFPLVYVPTVIFYIEIEYSHWIIASVVLLTQFILISLYNIQNQLEYPFDEVGLDDIKLESFRIYR
ncbi:MAG: hypothetical protein WBM83_02995 [Flavobacteriaceae bacterium]